MLFIYPIWDNESQRIGKQKCTPLGYKLHGTAEGLGLISEALYRFSWKLADMKGFQYDHETRTANWMEAGQRREYKWESDRKGHHPK